MEDGRDHFESESSENSGNMDIENEEHAEENSHENNDIAEELEEDFFFWCKYNLNIMKKNLKQKMYINFYLIIIS